MNTFLTRLVFTGLLTFSIPALLAVADDSKPAPPPAPDLTTKLADTENKLATALRSYEQLQQENEQLKGATATDRAELEKLRQEKSAAAAAPTDLADAQNKLATALRSYSLLEAENDRIKADDAKAIFEAQTSAAKTSAEAATQIAGLRDDLRQTQAQAAALVAENSQLKTHLALAGPPPGTTLAAPSRPGTPAAEAAVQPETQSPKPETVAAPPRTHVVAAGDSLAKISRLYYGTTNRWDEILRANRDVIKNENILPLGATLRIP